MAVGNGASEDVLTFADVVDMTLREGERTAIAWEAGGKFSAQVGPAQHVGKFVRQDADHWWTPNPTRLPLDTRRKGGADEIARLAALPSDIDHDTEDKATGVPDLAACYRISDEITRRTGLAPSAYIESGAGLQPQILADPDDDAAGLDTEEKRERAKRLCRLYGRITQHIAAELYAGAQIDSVKVANLDRLHRVPGSRNHKYPHKPTVVARTGPGRQYTLDEIEEGLARVGLPEEPTTAAEAPVPSGQWETFDEARRERVLAYGEESVMPGIEGDLRAMQSWPVGHRDERERGWEKRTADEFLRAERLFLAIPALDAEAWRKRLLAAAPKDARWTEEKVMDKLESQIKAARRKGPADLSNVGHEPYTETLFTADGTVRPHEKGVPVTGATTKTSIHQGQARMAYRLAEKFEGRLIHVHGIGWYSWDGKRWAEDDRGAATRAVLATLRDELVASMKLPQKERDEARRDVRRCESAPGVRGVLDIAAALPQFARTVSDLDPDPYLLNCTNGTLDLRTGQMRPPDPADLITKVTRAAYAPGAVGGQSWQAFLERVLPTPEVREFLQRYTGVALAGTVLEHVLAILTGTGRNGKGVFYGAVSNALGDYATTAEPDLFMHREGAHPTGEMDLLGVRWVVVSESDKGRKLAEATVKRLTGGDAIKARRMRKDFVKFEPSHTPVLVTNHLPMVSGDDTALWERLVVVPFDVFIPAAERDPHLGERLKIEADAILTWAVEGWRAYQAGGLAVPPEVRRATDAYQASSDTVGQFLKERCATNPAFNVRFAELFSAYQSWAAEEGIESVGRRDFGTSLDAAGHRSVKGSGNVAYRQGLRIVAGQEG